MRKLKLIPALREVIDSELNRDPRTCFFGEDIGAYGGVWGLAKGLQQKYGERRVFDTPLGESGIIGTAVGAAMAGLRPIVELQYVDFITECMDPFFNQGAKLRFMSGGQIKIPMTLIAPCGAGTSEAAHHSNTYEAWFLSSPGVKLAMPSTIYDAMGLLRSAIRDDNPSVLLWHKVLFDLEEEVPEEDWQVPLGVGAVRREGTDLTIVAYSLTVKRVLDAVESVDSKISVEVLDPRTLNPLDLDMIRKSVRKTGHLLVVHESPARCGVGRDIVGQIVACEWQSLKDAPQVLGGADLPIPFAKPLENACIPQSDDIAACIETMMHG
jgi:pyruvate dehydrogenase E1 component beta subunit